MLAAGIRTLQCILLKVALLMGVEVHTGVTFDGLVEPDVTGAESRPSSFFASACIVPLYHAYRLVLTQSV